MLIIEEIHFEHVSTIHATISLDIIFSGVVPDAENEGDHGKEADEELHDEDDVGKVRDTEAVSGDARADEDDGADHHHQEEGQHLPDGYHCWCWNEEEGGY